MLPPTSRPRIVLGITCACALVVFAAGARAQGAPGKPGGDWLAYRPATLTNDQMQRCGITPAVLAEWRKTVDEVASVVATSPALAGLAGHVPEMASHVDFLSPPDGTDCKKFALSASVVLWPWMNKHVEPDPAARPGGPTFRLKGHWVNNTFGALWVSINANRRFAGDPWEKDERGVFFEQPEPLRDVAGFPMYEEHIFIAGPANLPLFLPVSQERVINAYLVRARQDAPISQRTLDSRKTQYENFMSPASQEKRKKEIEAAAASQKNPANSEQERRHAIAIDERREQDYRKAMIWVKDGIMSRQLGTSDVDMMTKVDRAVVRQTDWARLAQMMK
jgi:hypothetical protein